MTTKKLSTPELRVRVSYFCQIRGSWTRVQFAQQAVISGLRFQLGNFAVGVVDVAEDDRACGTRLLAGGLDFRIVDLAIFAFGVDAALVDALDAVRTFFHDAAAAHAD